MMITIVDTTPMITDMLATTTVATATLTVTTNVSVDVPDQMLVTVLLAFLTPILTNTVTVFVTHTGLVRVVIPTVDHATTNATAAMAQMQLTVATVYLTLTGTTTTLVSVKLTGQDQTVPHGTTLPVQQPVNPPNVMDHQEVTVRYVLITPHGTNTDTVSVTATGPERAVMFTSDHVIHVVSDVPDHLTCTVPTAHQTL